MDVRQAPVDTVVTVSQPRVVDPEQMQHGSDHGLGRRADVAHVRAAG